MDSNSTVLNWAKSHKKEFVRDLVEKSGVAPDSAPAAIFMAGLPGAGKTELSKSIIEDARIDFLRIDMDEIAAMLPGYIPSQADEFRRPATLLLSELFTYALRHQLDFVMDGTFGSKKATENISRSLKHGYAVQIVYAFQDPKLAWEFTRAREKVEHRAIEFDGFIEAYYHTINNVKAILDEFGDSISLDIAVKTHKNKVGRWLRDVKAAEIDKILNVEYNKDKLIEYIKGA